MDGKKNKGKSIKAHFLIYILGHIHIRTFLRNIRLRTFPKATFVSKGRNWLSESAMKNKDLVELKYSVNTNDSND